MRKLSFFLTIALVLVFSPSLFAGVNDIYISNVTNTWDGVGNVAGNWTTNNSLRAGSTHVISITFDATGGAGYTWLGTNAFELYSPDGADWSYFHGQRGPYIWALPLKYSVELGLCGPLESFLKHGYQAGGGANPIVTTAEGPNITKCFCFVEPCNVPDFYTTVPAGGNINGNDVVMFYHAAVGSGVGFSGGSQGLALTAEFTTDVADEGKTMCFDTNGVYQAWEWAAAGYPLDNGSDFPNWDNGQGVDGPICWDIFVVPNIPPEWCGPTSANRTFNHCGSATYTLCATDGGDGGPVTYAFAPGFETGFGTLNATTGVWTWSGPTVPQEDNSIAIQFIANDGSDDTAEPFTLNVVTTNNAPTAVCSGVRVPVGVGTPVTQKVTVGDLDNCDNLTVTVSGTGFDAGNVTVGAIVAGKVSITFSPAAPARDVDMTVEVFDGVATTTCDLLWAVVEGSFYQIEIGKDSMTIQGTFAQLPITLHSISAEQGLGGFDLLLAYDASALVFQTATEGTIYTECGWEYFTYRYGAFGNCGSACPSGMLRVIGMAETNNGPYYAGCVSPTDPGYVGPLPTTLASLRFLISNDRTLECQYVPVRFIWLDCGDNTLSNHDGSELYVSEHVYEFVEYNNPFIGGELFNPGDQYFPTYVGAPDVNGDPYRDCVFIDGEKVAKRNVGFQNGGFDIACADSIDARGDINLNGLAYEIADAVMFTNYFIEGLNAFPDIAPYGRAGAIAASDCNADGLALTVADLVYLIRVIIGDALPYDKLAPIAAQVTVGNGIMNVNAEMGAAFVVVSGNVSPRLLSNQMEMRYGFDGVNTNILVFSTEGHSFSNDFLSVEGRIVSTEFASANGASVVAKIMPSNFTLKQNYPNPFNPTTVVEFEIPGGGAWKMQVYNITGQLVNTFDGVSESGFESVEWDASDLSSGIYFYRLTAGENSMTKKAVLLK